MALHGVDQIPHRMEDFMEVLVEVANGSQHIETFLYLICNTPCGPLLHRKVCIRSYTRNFLTGGGVVDTTPYKLFYLIKY